MPADFEEAGNAETQAAFTTAAETAAPEREPFWGYFDLMLVIGLSFAAAVLILTFTGLLAKLFPTLKDDPTPIALPLQILLYVFIYLAFLITFRTRYGRPVFSSLGWRRVSFNPGLAAIGGVALAIAVGAIASALHVPKVDSPMDRFTESPGLLLFFAIFAVTLGPLSEELIFRGFLQPLLSRTFGVAAGIVITALIFGCLHGPEYSWAWQYILAVSLAGMAFGWLRARTNSVIPSTLMHGSYNAIFLIAFIAAKHTPIK